MAHVFNVPEGPLNVDLVSFLKQLFLPNLLRIVYVLFDRYVEKTDDRLDKLLLDPDEENTVTHNVLVDH